MHQTREGAVQKRFFFHNDDNDDNDDDGVVNDDDDDDDDEDDDYDDNDDADADADDVNISDHPLPGDGGDHFAQSTRSWRHWFRHVISNIIAIPTTTIIIIW